MAARRLRGLVDTARPGKPKTYGADTEARILAMLDQAPPQGYARWNGTLLAKALKDVSADQIWRVLRQRRISLKVSGWRSHLADLSQSREDRVHLFFWWTREYFRERLRGSASSSPA